MGLQRRAREASWMCFPGADCLISSHMHMQRVGGGMASFFPRSFYFVQTTKERFENARLSGTESVSKAG